MDQKYPRTRMAVTNDSRVDWPASPSKAALAANDLIAGLVKAWMWSALAMQDIKLRYRGSVLGPFWITISMVVMIASMGVIYSRLFGLQTAIYMPYLTIGLVTWQFISTLIIEGSNTFIAAEPIIQQVSLPFSTYVFRVICRNLIVLAHNAIIIPVVMLIFHVRPSWEIVLLPFALLVICVNASWICFLFGMVSARFRDVPPVIASFVQVVFFITPIFWKPDTLGRLRFIVDFNPLFAAVDVIRAPLTGAASDPFSWPLLLIVTVLGGFGTFVFFARFRSRIAYWV